MKLTVEQTRPLKVLSTDELETHSRIVERILGLAGMLTQKPTDEMQVEVQTEATKTGIVSTKKHVS